jgi:hypothetical protein
MPKESLRKKVGRIRPPRVHMTYDVQVGDAIEKRDIPFVVGILADLSGVPDKPLPPIAKRKFVSIDRDDVSDVMKKIGPRLAFKVPNRLNEDGTKPNVELRFERKHPFVVLDLSRLGKASSSDSVRVQRCQRTAAFIGDEVWNQQARFRIRLGPVGLDRFVEFLPDSRALPQLMELTRYIVRQASAFNVQVLLRAAAVPYCRLHDDGFDAPRLGWMGWLKTEEFRTDVSDAMLEWIN